MSSAAAAFRAFAVQLLVPPFFTAGFAFCDFAFSAADIVELAVVLVLAPPFPYQGFFFPSTTTGVEAVVFDCLNCLNFALFDFALLEFRLGDAASKCE